jgi:hypothetical protein
MPEVVGLVLPVPPKVLVQASVPEVRVASVVVALKVEMVSE